MTIEEKQTHIMDLLLIQGNTAKLVRALVAEALACLPEDRLDHIISILEAE